MGDTSTDFAGDAQKWDPKPDFSGIVFVVRKRILGDSDGEIETVSAVFQPQSGYQKRQHQGALLKTQRRSIGSEHFVK